MKTIRVHFEPDPALDRIEVTVRAPELDEDVAALMDQLSGHPPDTFMAFDGAGNLCALPAGDIVMASVEGKLVSIVTEDGKWFTRRSLQSLEDELDSRWFIRVSRYELVNLKKVRRYDFTLAGTLRLELAGGMETWASRRCIPAIRKRLLGKE